MINKMQLEHFKCFDQIGMELKNVNILTGFNGMGKSTILQALLLLKQSRKSLQTEQKLLLNGELTRLGIGRDILCELSEQDDEIVFEIEEDTNCRLCFRYEAYSDMLEMKQKNIKQFPSFMDKGRCVYLSSFRIQPTELYDITNKENLDEKNFGIDGLYTLQFLKEYGQMEILDELAEVTERCPNTLYAQVRHWMGGIAPGVEININVDNQKKIADLGYSFVEGANRTNVYKCVNVGFGITYVLPVVIALLSAQKGDLIIIENPEAHIHPTGQRRLGELIAKAGEAGIQVIVETHSDHIVNGIRIAVKNKILKKTNVNLFYFYKDEEDEFHHKYIMPAILDNGRLDKMPKGFCDEWDNALLDLL